ncbi:hypothetical protein IBX73_03960 [candidate division WOR-3 bacterium]|nr:hypothetical protein [candidate division WOR-3 bacterium]
MKIKERILRTEGETITLRPAERPSDMDKGPEPGVSYWELRREEWELPRPGKDAVVD